MQLRSLVLVIIVQVTITPRGQSRIAKHFVTAPLSIQHLYSLINKCLVRMQDYIASPECIISGWIQDFLREGGKPSSGSLKQGVWVHSPPEAIGCWVFEVPKSSKIQSTFDGFLKDGDKCMYLTRNDLKNLQF